MKKQRYVLRDFAPDNGHWMVKGISRILKSANNQSFKSTEVILGKIKDNNMGVNESAFAICEENEVITHQNISNIPLFTPGSVWESVDGKSSLVSTPNTANKYFQFCQSSRAEYVQLSSIISRDELFSLGFGKESGEAFYLSISRPGQPHYILLPCSEILRADYGSSPTLIQAAIASWIEFTPERFINTKISTPISSNGYATPPFASFTKGVSWKKDTVVTLGNMYFDQYCRSVQAATYSSVVQSISKDKTSANLALRPLSNKLITLGAIVEEQSVYVHEMPNAKRYIVRKITHWDAPLPIKQFTYRFEMDNSKAPHSGPLKRFKFPARLPFKRKLNIDPTEVLSEEQADANKQAIILGVTGPTKPEIDRIECEKLVKLEQKYERFITPPKEHDNTEGSTGEKSYQDDLPPEVLFEIDDVGDEHQRAPANLVMFCDAVMLLQEEIQRIDTVGDVNISSIQLDGCWPLNSAEDKIAFWVNPFPSKVGTKESSKFAYITKPPHEIPRTYLMIELTVGEAVFVLIESERVDGDTIPTYIACKKQFNPFIFHEFKQLIGCMSVSKTSIFPRHSLLHIHRQRINHVSTDTAESLKKRLCDYIIDALVYDKGRLVLPPNVDLSDYNSIKHS